MKFEPSLARFKCAKEIATECLEAAESNDNLGGRVVAFAIRARKNINVFRRIYINGESIDPAIRQVNCC